ncbi:RND multidrug efflux transporter; Acriflavin resistance protein [hydrothermal vent metagenome]|uniref:RND multidrug efflux transporter Acriflavin resistance protein n=1 Tax=hydrothermal vent metagenome TaxID=652676 RepID=A0A1W1CSK8_9ZZZZ
MIRKFIEFAIEKPLLNHILLIFILMLSIFAYINIPKEIFPPMNMDKITIKGGYAGTSADILDKMVVQSIEDDLQNIDALEDIKSSIKNGSFSISATIRSGANNILVLNDVKDAINSVKKDLPSDMNEPIAKIKTHSFPLVLIALSGDVTTKELLSRADELKSELSKFKDLSDITIRGDAKEELDIKLNTEKIKAYGLSPSLVVAQISKISSIFPIGTIKQKADHLYISTYNGEKTKEGIANTIIDVGGNRVQIGDIATVAFKLSDAAELSHYNGKRNISINVTKSKNGNAIALVRDIRKLLKKEKLKHPNLNYNIYTDTSIWIKNRLNVVFSNIVFGLVLVFLAMLIFINRGIAFVVALGIPVSFMIGLIVTELLGDSLNMLSLLGALIALGMLVDEAIVVAENIYRHLEEGMDRKEAVINGAAEMFPAVLAATLTTVLAFLPMLLMTGEMGMFIKIIPIMITVLLLSSLFEAFYFLPLHSYDFLKVAQGGSFTKRFWEKMYGAYSRLLHFFFRRKGLSLAAIVVTILAFEFVMIKNAKFQLFPDFDTTQIYVYGKVNINNDLQDTEKIVTKVEKEILQNVSKQNVSSVTSVIGFKMDAKNRAELGENMFHIFIDLHERAPANFFDKYISPYLSLEYDAKVRSRELDAKVIAKRLQKVLLNLKNEKLKNGKNLFEEFVVKVPGAGIIAHDIEIGLSAKDGKDVVPYLKTLEQKLAKIQGVHNISDDATLGEKELKLRVNAYGQELGFNEQIISNDLRAYYLKGEYGKLFDAQGLVRIRIESGLDKAIHSIQNVELQVPASNKYVALKDICDYSYLQSYVTLKKEDGKRVRSLYASIDKKIITSSEVMDKIRPFLNELKAKGVTVDIKGEEKENNKNKREMMQSGLIAIFLIFITLVWLFDSIKKSLIVISTIPLVLLGVYIGNWLMGLNLTMPGLIGVVGLAGVVVNDGLIMVDFIKNAKDTEELMRRAKTRLRPILLTSLTTVLGLLTLIFFASGQAKILQPMAVSLGYGIAWATVLNLIYIPLLYAVVYKIKAPKIAV